MTCDDSDSAYELIVVRRRGRGGVSRGDFSRRGVSRRELVTGAVRPRSRDGPLRRTRTAASDGECGRPGASGGEEVGWDLLKVLGLCWLLTQPVVLLGFAMAAGWFLITAARETVVDEFGR